MGGGVKCALDGRVSKLRIAAYGDSTTLGPVDDPAASMPSYLSQKLCGAEVLNEGVGGTRAEQLLHGTDGRHLPWKNEVAKLHSDIIPLNYGINDTYRGTESLDEYRHTMLELVKIAKQAGKRVFLQTPNPVYVSDVAQEPYEPIMTLAPKVTARLSFKRHMALQQRVDVIKDIGKKEKLPVIDANLVMLELTQKIPLEEAYIGVHPRAIGYQAIANEAAKIIRLHLRLQ